MNRIGIMQGRLVPSETDHIQAFPIGRWRDEFALAAAAGIDAIEWIVDDHGDGRNPLDTAEGVREILALSQETGVAIAGVCDDWLMPNALVRVDDRLACARTEQLGRVVERCRLVGGARVVVPLVDASEVRTPDEESAVVLAIESVLPIAERAGVELHLETSLPPDRLGALLARLQHELVRVTYDSGNSAACGYSPQEEFAAYGDRVGSVHVKDRVLGGGTVPLGNGDSDLAAVFAELAAHAFSGDIILQVARGATGGEVALARRNRATVERLIAAAL